MPRKFDLEVPDTRRRKIVSREYKIFQEEDFESSLPRTLYEKAANASARILRVEADKKTQKSIQDAIDFSHLKTTPTGVASLTILFAFAVCLPTIMLIMFSIFGLPGLDPGMGMLVLMMALPFVYYMYVYPTHLKKRYESATGSEMVSMVLYMAMFLRNVPNMEQAVRFASENVSEPLSYELHKLFWDLEIRRYLNIEDALSTYASKWSDNKEFVQSMEIMVSSLRQPGERRIEMLDEAVEVILAGNRERAKRFNQQLKFPVTIVHAMGILLPVMGLVLFPVVAVFLQVNSLFLFIAYDIMLPLILFFVITKVLEKRPITYSKIDISENPDVPKEGCFKLKNRDVPSWPFGLLVFFVIALAGFFSFALEGEQGILSAVLFGASVSFGFAVHYLLLSKKRLEVRQRTRAIEQEFAEALFQIGNQIYGGTPIEVSMEQSVKRIENLRIKDLFARALTNIKMFGMTFSQAFFDQKYGAVRYYPSKLIKSVMRTVAETSKKGVKVASVAMLSVSKYLKDLHRTQEEVDEELSDVTNSLKFQVYFLSPFISGVVVTMAIIIIRILQELSERLGSASSMSASSVPSFGLSFANIEITPFQFVIIVAAYLIESAFILSFFINGIENGEDKIGRYDITAYGLVIGYVIFAVSLFVTLSIFGPLIMISTG